MHVTLKVGSTVFLSGPTGIGKTALASVLATAYIASNSGGVLWFSVLEDTIELLIARVGRAYGVNALTVQGEDISNNVEIVRALLEKNRPLIVLDGMIDLDAVRDFARQCAVKVPVIITNELPGAGPWTPINLESLSDADSQALFKFYSGLKDPAYAADIAGLCKFLGGIPVSIQLAGRLAAIDDLTPAELMSSLPSSSGQDSQYMLMAAVFKRLPPSVQAMLLVLSATPTGTASAELISDLSNVPSANIVPLMRQLVSRGVAHELVTYGQFAYSLQECAQIYTRNWLQQYQRLQITENRALKAVLTYVYRHAHNTPTDHDRLAAEMDNILGVAAFATETGQEDAVRQLIHLLNGAGDFVVLRGFQPELEQMKKLFTLLIPAQPAQPSPEAIAQSTADTKPVQPPGVAEAQPAVSKTETQEAAVTEPPADAQATPVVPRQPMAPQQPPAAPTSQPGEAVRSKQPFFAYSREITQPASPISEAIKRAEPSQEKEATPLPERTPVEPVRAAEPQGTKPAEQAPIEQAAPAEAAVQGAEATPTTITEPPRSPEDTQTPTELSLPTLEKQLADARAANDKPTEAKLLHTLGQYYADHGSRAEAQTNYKQALETYEALDDNDGILATLDALAAITAQADDVEGALVYATRGVNLAQQTGERDRLGRLQTRLGDVRLALGDLPAAIEAYTQAAETLRGTENWLAIGMVMAKLGNVHLEQGKSQEAIMMLEQALVIFRRERNADYESRVLGAMGTAYAATNQWAKARDNHELALSLARQHANQTEEAAELAALAHICEIQNDRPGAIQDYRQALHVAYQLEDIDLQAEYDFELGRLLMDDTRTLMQAVQLLRESDSLVPNGEARRLLSRADKRVERTRAAGMTLPPVEGSNQDYAAAAYDGVGSTVSQPNISG